jgi:hypothetical protein
MMPYPASGSTVSNNRVRTATGLSTTIVVKVFNYTVGAIQQLTINQDRELKRYTEIGNDGVVEIIPSLPATVTINVNRLVFDGMSMTEAFARAFINIQSQRFPFNIDIYDFSVAGELDIGGAQNVDRAPTIKRIQNCWFKSLSTPYNANNYLIAETAVLWAERITTFTPSLNNSIHSQLSSAWGGKGADVDTIEKEFDTSGGRGSLGEPTLEPANKGRRTLHDLASSIGSLF